MIILLRNTIVQNIHVSKFHYSFTVSQKVAFCRYMKFGFIEDCNEVNYVLLTERSEELIKRL